jgi:hypothetical protein
MFSGPGTHPLTSLRYKSEITRMHNRISAHPQEIEEREGTHGAFSYAYFLPYLPLGQILVTQIPCF